MPTILDHLHGLFPAAKRTTLRRMIDAGRVLVDGRPARRAGESVDATHTVRVLDRAPSPVAPTRRSRLDVVHEDRRLIVINKPAGVLTSTSPTDSRAGRTLIATARREYGPGIELVHRLDRDASGLIVLARDIEARDFLKQQFVQKTATRLYRAIVDGVPAQHQITLHSRLLELPDGRMVATRNKSKGVEAITHAQVIERRPPCALLEVRLETGRKHQIRSQLAERGWPIVGDRMYHCGSSRAPRLMLCAVGLELLHPDGPAMRWQIVADPVMEKWWSALR